jgi:hypothetical protein
MPSARFFNLYVLMRSFESRPLTRGFTQPARHASSTARSTSYDQIWRMS